MIGVPTLLLRTTGRRSGATRSNGLTYARDGEEPPGGRVQWRRRPSPWFHNLMANPDVEVQIGRERRTRIIEVSDADNERLWKLVNTNNRGRYSAYQQKTTRPITRHRDHAQLIRPRCRSHEP